MVLIILEINPLAYIISVPSAPSAPSPPTPSPPHPFPSSTTQPSTMRLPLALTPFLAIVSLPLAPTPCRLSSLRPLSTHLTFHLEADAAGSPSSLRLLAPSVREMNMKISTY